MQKLGNDKSENLLQKEQIIQFLSLNKEILSQKYNIKKIGLFGSYARDEANDESDIDIILEFKDNTENIFDIKFQLVELIKNEFHKDVDIAREKYLKPRVKEKILKEAIYAEK